VRVNSGKACYHSDQNHLCSHLLSRDITIRICKSIILPVILCDLVSDITGGTWTGSEECRLVGCYAVRISSLVWTESV
jgi:hypothetical protein